MSDTEKVSINMNVVDLGQVDLLIGQGFYSSRTDFIRTAVRNLLLTHAPTVQQAVASRLSGIVGVMTITRRSLEKLREEGKQMDLWVVGLLSIAHDVNAELARATIRSLKVFGVFRASGEVKAALQGASGDGETSQA